jgi:hypothetical protein
MEEVRLGEVIKEIVITQFMRIIERFVKNDTPYLGRLVLRFEKNTDYKSTKKGFLNKIHLDFKFFKLVTRLIPEINDNKLMPDPDKVALIEKYTGGIIVERRVKEKELNDILLTKHNFLTKDKRMVGDIFTAWDYFKNQMVIVEENPKGVALVYKDRKPYEYIVLDDKEKISVKIGDRIFDENYMSSMANFKRDEWKKWYKKYIRDYYRADEKNKKRIKEEGIIKYIPYNMRGIKKIKTLEEAKITAINIIKQIRKDDKK